MRLRWGGCHRRGAAVDLRDAHVDGRALIAAVRDPGDDRVSCAPPGPAHEQVGFVHPSAPFDRRRALAAAARSRGETAPQDEALRAVEERLEGLEVPSVDLDAARRRVATAGEEEDELRERVARLAGRVEARRELDADPGPVERELADAARELAERETERLAAEQALERAHEAAREARDARERRLRLLDRRRNLRRAAREHLASGLEEAFRGAVEAAPGDAAPDGAVDGVTGSLAAARVAALDAPVVVACGRFDGPSAAAAYLDAPVVLV